MVPKVVSAGSGVARDQCLMNRTFNRHMHEGQRAAISASNSSLCAGKALNDVVTLRIGAERHNLAFSLSFTFDTKAPTSRLYLLHSS